MIARTRGSVWGLVARLLSWAAIAAGGTPIARAQETSGLVGCAEALNETIRSGMPTVVLVTSRAAPASIGLRDAIARELPGSSIGRSVRFAEMPVELYADRVEQLGIRQFPTLLAYGRRDGALERLGQLSGAGDPAQVAAWLGSIGLVGDPSTSGSDPAVSRAGLLDHHRGAIIAVPMANPSPSPQHPAPPPPAKPQPPVSVPIQAAPPSPPAQSMVVAQGGGTPLVVQPQSPSIYIQPQAPKIYLGQMPAPEITVIQGPQQAPTVQYAVVNPQPAPPAMVAVPQPQATPYAMPSPQSPTVATSAPSYSMVAVPQGAGLVASAPGAGLGAVPQPQQSIVGTTAIALLLENPDLINSMIGVLGRGFSLLGGAMEKHSHPRVRLPRPETAPASGMLTLVPGTPLPQASAVPLMGLQAQPSAPVPLYQAPPAPPVVVPSPQSAPPGHFGAHSGGSGGLFSRWKK